MRAGQPDLVLLDVKSGFPRHKEVTLAVTSVTIDFVIASSGGPGPEFDPLLS